MAVPLKDILSTILEKNDWKLLLARNWKEVIGSLQTRVRLETIYQDTLVIGVYEYHWMQELYLLTPLLRKKINDFLQEERIKHLRFKLVEERPRPERKQPQPKIILPKKVLLTGQQKAALEKLSDDQLKKELLEFWRRCSAVKALP